MRVCVLLRKEGGGRRSFGFSFVLVLVSVLVVVVRIEQDE